MTLPSFLTEKNVYTFMKMGALAVVSLVALGIIGYILYLILSGLSVDVAAMKADLPFVRTNTETLMRQHMEIGPAMQENARIQCAVCWNAAQSQEELERCNCSPEKK